MDSESHSSVEVRQYNDIELVRLVVARSEAALAELYDRHGRAAYGLAFRVVRDARLAEDAVQEAFLDVWRSASRFELGRLPARGWILVLAHRRSVDLVRREERRRTLPLDARATAAVGASDDEAFLSIQRAAVRDALDRLPAAERQAIELAYYEGFTQLEIAERVGLPLGTVKSRTFSGLARLRSLLAPVEETAAMSTAA